MDRVFCTGQITREQLPFVKEQIAKQTVQPKWAVFYIDEKPAIGIDARRKRIAANHAKLVELVRDEPCDYVWQIEGDSVLPTRALERLLERAATLDDFGFISGSQVGRHGVPCIGAWHVSDGYFESVDYMQDGLQEIDATGWYCMLAKKDIWLKGQASWDNERYGPDVVWGLTIPKPKYIDLDLMVGHKTPTGVIYPTDIQVCNVSYTYNIGLNKWVFKQK